MNMKNISIYIAALLFGCILFSSCEKEEIGGTAAEKIAGEWVVNYYLLENNQLVNYYGPYTIDTYNTSLSIDSIWIQNIYDEGIKVKSKKLSETTFGVSEGIDVDKHFDGTIGISEAQVINNDSIIYHVVLTNSDGTNKDDYYAAGHRYTGFRADD